jgi:hypothetical protein
VCAMKAATCRRRDVIRTTSPHDEHFNARGSFRAGTFSRVQSGLIGFLVMTNPANIRWSRRAGDTPDGAGLS